MALGRLRLHPQFGGPGTMCPWIISEILRASQYVHILVLFGVVCVGQHCQAKIVEGRQLRYSRPSIFYWGGASPLAPEIDATDLLRFNVVLRATRYISLLSPSSSSFPVAESTE